MYVCNYLLRDTLALWSNETLCTCSTYKKYTEKRKKSNTALIHLCKKNKFTSIIFLLKNGSMHFRQLPLRKREG